MFSWPVRVYYEDSDAAGVVYYANYLKYFERARSEWLRALGFEQPALERDYAVVFVVRKLTVEYLRPALFNDLLNVSVEPIAVGSSLIEIAHRVRRESQTLVSAEVKVACVNTRLFKPVRIPQPIKEKIVVRSE